MTVQSPTLPARPRVLVVALRRLGDVLLATPLIRSIRRAWPEAALDAGKRPPVVVRVNGYE